MNKENSNPADSTDKPRPAIPEGILDINRGSRVDDRMFPDGPSSRNEQT